MDFLRHLRHIASIFRDLFLYNFLVRDPGKRVHSDASDALTSLAGAGVFGARRNSWKWAFGRVSGTWKGSAIPEPEGPGPTPPKPGGLAGSRVTDPALNRSSHAVWQLPGTRTGTGPGRYRHIRHIASNFRDLFYVHFSRKRSRKTGTMCRKRRRAHLLRYRKAEAPMIPLQCPFSPFGAPLRM